jgi:superfamily II DNA or RNA helicase
MLAVIQNVIRLKKSTSPPELLDIIRSELTVENPAYHQMQMMQYRNPRKYQYAKLPPSTIMSYDEAGDTLYIPRGYRSRLEELSSEHGQSISWHDKTIAFDRVHDMCQSPNVTLKNYQRRGLGKMVMSGNGVLVAPCGGGKTVTGIGILTTLKQPTLVVVHKTDLMSQWQEELADKADLPGPIGQWGGGVKQRETVTVATIQTLNKMPPAELVKFLEHFGCVILDEAHHCPADTFMGIMNLSPSRYRFGLTATPERKDGLEELMYRVIGPVRAEITDSELVAEGRSQTCEVVEVDTKFYTRHTASEWTKLLGELTKDGDRNRLIVSNIVKDWNDGQFPLVLSDRVGHCRQLQQMLRGHGMDAQLLIGAVNQMERDRIMSRARQGLVDAIIATKVADEGLDIPALSSIHLTSPTANKANTQQRVGRIRRPVPGKRSVVFDYVDLRVPCLARMAKSRRTMFKRWGFSFTKPD